MKELLQVLLEKPEIIVTILSGFLLPIALVWLNNHYNLRNKTKEKQLDIKYNSKEEIRRQEKAVYASLSKILFDVQQLHVSLSGTCVDENCINDALTKFDDSIIKYHEEISNNLLYMSSTVINDIYKFYSRISALKISLKEFNDSRNFEMAHVSVYLISTELAEIVIGIQEKLLGNKSDLEVKFDKTQQEMMTYCCGQKPPEEIFEKYMELLQKLKPNTTELEIEIIQKRFGQ